MIQMEANLKKFQKGEVIFTEGTFEMCMYELVSGTVGIYANYGKEHEKLLVELKAETQGVTFGEMGLIDEMPRSATAVALDDVEAILVTKETFGIYVKENPAQVIRMMQQMSKRIRSLTQNYLDACRAVAEAVESEKSGKEKSSWFKKMVDRFVADYTDAMEAAASSNPYYRRHVLGYKEDIYEPYDPYTFW